MDIYQYDLVKKLSFVRYGGTEEELKAAEMIAEEVKRLGGKADIEDFSIPAWNFESCSVKVISPFVNEYEALPWGLSGSLPEGGAELKLFYAEDGSEAAFYGINDLSDTAVMVNDLTLDVYKRLCERKAAAILIIKGKWYDSRDNSDLLWRNAKPTFLSFGKIPAIFIWSRDAAEMVKERAEKVHLELKQSEFENTSHNVVTTVLGTDIPDEELIITAHIDSVNVGTGSWDNATGAATAMYIYRHFLENPPKRTIHFVWCGSEEQGLLGSKAYIDAHPELFENKIKLGFNFDMCGTILGHNKVCVTSTEELKNYAEAFCGEYGINAAVYRDVRSSDSANIADRGIPTIDILRRCNAAEIHTRYDLMDMISAEQLKRDGDFSIAFIERVANSVRLPVGLEMPDDMREMLDKYFLRPNNRRNKKK